MNRIDLIPEHEDFFKSLKLTLNEFANEYNVSTYEYFGNKLHFKSNAGVQLSNLLNSNTNKDLKVRELITLLDNSSTHQAPVLNYLCNRYNFACSNIKDCNESNTNKQNVKDENIKDLLINIAGSNGNLSNDFLNFHSDGLIDELEKEKLIKDSYESIAILFEFINNLKKS